MQAKAIAALVILIVGVVIGWLLKPDPEPLRVVTERTTHKTDTIYREIRQQPVYITKIVPETRPQVAEDLADFGPILPKAAEPAPYVDSTRQVIGKDTVTAAYASPQRTFRLGLLRGPDTAVTIRDSVLVERTVERTKRQLIGFGFFGGYGFGLQGQASGWTVGVGVTVNFLTLGI